MRYYTCLCLIPVFLSVSGCTSSTGEGIESTSTTSQAVSSGNPITAAKPMQHPPVQNMERFSNPNEKAQRQSEGASPGSAAPTVKCPHEKQGDAYWTSVAAEKEKHKTQKHEASISREVKTKTPSPEQLERQRRFYAKVKEKQAEFDAMKPDERESAYSALKESMLGN